MHAHTLRWKLLDALPLLDQPRYHVLQVARVGATFVFQLTSSDSQTASSRALCEVLDFYLTALLLATLAGLGLARGSHPRSHPRQIAATVGSTGLGGEYPDSPHAGGAISEVVLGSGGSLDDDADAGSEPAVLRAPEASMHAAGDGGCFLAGIFTEVNRMAKAASLQRPPAPASPESESERGGRFQGEVD